MTTHYTYYITGVLFHERYIQYKGAIKFWHIRRLSWTGFINNAQYTETGKTATYIVVKGLYDL